MSFELMEKTLCRANAKKHVMRRSSDERRSGSKERGQTKSLTGDGEIMIEIEIAIARGTNVADEWTKTRIAMIRRAVIGEEQFFPFVIGIKY